MKGKTRETKVPGVDPATVLSAVVMTAPCGSVHRFRGQRRDGPCGHRTAHTVVICVLGGFAQLRTLSRLVSPPGASDRPVHIDTEHCACRPALVWPSENMVAAVDGGEHEE